ncbi:hypothetical protein AVEN_166233-1 [Araneus ventricosus]|uniref:Uncharacterized protein n=1 Tax=Araneus ventricosus TaxID=182803 RepID=A0A4Y2FTC5_ARAVE|nr:hypothetical protein AVEN_166233-1 [Araneus ventricosus]
MCRRSIHEAKCSERDRDDGSFETSVLLRKPPGKSVWRRLAEKGLHTLRPSSNHHIASHILWEQEHRSRNKIGARYSSLMI